MEKEYNIIYADPPWRYDFSKDSKDRIEEHYPTMSLEEIKELDVPAKKNSLLYLWATAPKLQEALEVMMGWGFEYKTHAVWDKDWIGMGYWFRGQHELLLVGVKGRFSPPEQELRKSSVIRGRRAKHSKKPREIREWINKWYPDKSKLELFARKDRQPNLMGKTSFEGWDVWGNEVESDIAINKH